MESFESKKISGEQQEKILELSAIISSLSQSLSDSNEAYETATLIQDFKKKFENNGTNLKDYALGGLLLNNTLNASEYPYYDTENEEIEKFIRGLNQ